jgi:hypothetical protein
MHQDRASAQTHGASSVYTLESGGQAEQGVDYQRWARFFMMRRALRNEWKAVGTESVGTVIEPRMHKIKNCFDTGMLRQICMSPESAQHWACSRLTLNDFRLMREFVITRLNRGHQEEVAQKRPAPERREENAPFRNLLTSAQKLSADSRNQHSCRKSGSTLYGGVVLSGRETGGTVRIEQAY